MPSLLKAKGLYTYYNELSAIPDGALSRADNIIIDRSSVVEPRRGFGDYGDALPLDSDRVKQLMVYKGRILRHFNSTIEFDDGSGNFTAFSGSYSELETGLRIKFQEVNGNFYFTTTDGIKKISVKSASDLSSATIENAGGPKALDVAATVVPTIGGFFPANSKIAYRVVWGKKDNNNLLILGSPSSRTVISNTSADVNAPEIFTVDFSGASETDVAGKYILVDAANTSYFFWFSNAANNTEPETAETLGRTAIEVDVDGLGASDTSITTRYANAQATLTEFTTEYVSTTIVRGTSTEEGENVVDAAEETGGITNVTVTVTQQGSITTGDQATVDLTFAIPADVSTTDYFYQVYRTAATEATDTVTLDDIDPGDEMNLVFESGVTSAELTAGEVTLTDITPDSFRASGALLYTNPISGQGITQANEKPPIATDIALFRDSMFYANTKTIHRLQFNLLGLSDFVSGTSDFIIGNSTAARRYTFVGVAEESTITTDSRTNTTTGGYININSANDERQYYIWFDKTGTDTDPAVSGRTGIRVNISDATDSAAGTSDALTTVLNALDDFSATDGTGSVTVTNTNNGNTTDLTIGSALGGAWAVAVSTQGDGEEEDTAAGGDVLLSGLVSAGQSVDETARSIVKIINKDSNGIVYAYYLSGEDDLPGIILLESRSLTDDSFYLATSHSPIVERFSPELALEKSATVSISNPANFNTTSHGLVTGDTIYILDEGTVVPSIENNTYTVTRVDDDNFTIPVDATTGGTATWYKTDVESDNDEAPNRIYFSKAGQTEAVPLVNYIDVGPKDKAIRRIGALRDNLFILKDDGVYILTGNTAPNFTVRLLDSSIAILAPDSAAILDNQIFMLSDSGIALVSDTGVGIISRPIEDKILEVTDPNRYNFSTISFGIPYENDRAYMIWLPTKTTDTVGTQCYRYSTFTRGWTRWTVEATCGLVNPTENKMYVGSGNINYVQQERKNYDRSDYADRQFDLLFTADTISGTTVQPSDLTNIKEGDAFVQTQWVTISKFNRFLKKLDLDQGLDDTDYFSTLELTQGASLSNQMTALVAKLNADDSIGSYTFSGATDFETIKDEYNTIINTLNGASTDAIFSNYRTVTGTTDYEALATNVDTIVNEVTLNFEVPFIQGDFISYQSIDSDFQWAPQDFGEPSQTKQIRDGTLIFDGNNFYGGSLYYRTDLSKDFDQIEFLSVGSGDWGGITYGTSTWGGDGTDVPKRTLIPRQKQRCRYLTCRFRHKNARERFTILGMSLDPRAVSFRGYR